MDWFSIWYNVGTIAAMGVLQLFFVSRFTDKRPALWQYLVYLFLLYASDGVATALELSWLGIVTALLATYWMSRLALGNGSLDSWTAAILAAYVIQLSFGILNPLQLLLFPFAVGTSLLWLLVILAALLAFGGSLLCYWLILTRFSPRKGRDEASVWLLLTPGLFLFAVEFYLLDTAYGQVLSAPRSPNVGRQLILLALQVLALGALFNTLYAYRRTCDGFKAQAALDSLSQEVQAQRTYVAQAQLRYEGTRAVRHDLKNHLSVLEGLLKRGDPEQAGTYLHTLSGVVGELSFPVCTGNSVVDILLGDKLALARAGGASAEVSLTLPQPSVPVEDLDLCVIFANALDNALLACQQVEGPKTIRVSSERQGDFYMLEFENTCPQEAPLEMGIGLSNVKAVAEKYGGTMTIERRPNQYRLHVLLNISGQYPGHSRQMP